MAAPRKLTIPLVLLSGAALLGVVSIIYLLYALDKELTAQQRDFREDSVWEASQVEREARVFRHYLFLYSINDHLASHDELRQRFDVLWSRIEGMDKGEMGEMYAQLEGAAHALEHGRKMLRDVDPILQQLQPGDGEGRNAILGHVDPAVQNFYEVAKNAADTALQLQEAKRRSFEKTGKLTIILICIIFLSGAVLFIILLRNQYHLDHLTHNLEGTVYDRTVELKESNQSLKMMSQAIEQSPVSVVICNLEGKIDYVNQRFLEVTGYSFDECIGQNPKFIQSGRTSKRTYRQMWQVVHADKVWKGEICNKRKNGELFWEQVSFSPIKDEDDRLVGYLAVKEDISQRKMYEEELLKQANYDSLTGLPNRLLAMDRLKQAILLGQRRGDSVALLFIDLDNFKQINDTLGHDCGDYVLKKAAVRFHRCLRDCDTAARFGGDEFLIILSELQGAEDIKPIIKRIVEAFSRPFQVEGHQFLVTTSIGVSFYPEDGAHATELLKKSDSAMYIAKKKGKNNYCFFADCSS